MKSWLVVPFLASPLIAATLTLDHPEFSVSVTDDGGAAGFSVTEKSTGRGLVEHGVLHPGVKVTGIPAAREVNDPVLGPGRQIVIPLEDGSVAIETHPSSPFVIIRSLLENKGAMDSDTPTRVIANYTYKRPAATLRTLGTAGLKEPDKNPGSYLFLACANPATREGLVSGWITQNRGSGTVFSSVSDGGVVVKAQLEHGHLILKPGESATLDTLAIGHFPDARIGLEQFADTLAKAHHIALKPKAATYCTWYADGPGHGQAGNATTTAELSEFIKTQRLKEYGLGVIQVDDRWQAGPNIQGPATDFSRVKPDGPYKDGIPPVARQVKDDGLDFGLWWLPFGRNHMEPEFKDKQDWFVRKPDGTPLRQRSFGGTCLDSTHPAVREHLRSLASRMKDWGVDYFKMDGLSVGAGVDHYYINDGYKDDHLDQCLPLHDPSKTNIEALRLGLQTIREGAGPDIFFSGCCAVQNMRIYAGAIGLVDSMRVGPDFNHDGEGIRSGPLRGSWVYFLNGKVWWNDPDPTKVRTSGAKSDGDRSANGGVTLEQARLTSSWVSLTNQFFLISDWLPDLPPERLDILKRTMAAHHATARPVDYFDNSLPNTWLVTQEKNGLRRDVIGLFNFHPKPLRVNHTRERLGLDDRKSYHAFDFWENRRLPDLKETLDRELPPNSCMVIALRAVEEHPVLVSTSRHVTQGMLDVASETWSNDQLSGLSDVIAGDPYELRIVVPAGYEIERVRVSSKDVVDHHVDADGLLRVRFTPSKNGHVKWAVSFKKA